MYHVDYVYVVMERETLEAQLERELRDVEVEWSEEEESYERMDLMEMWKDVAIDGGWEESETWKLLMQGMRENEELVFNKIQEEVDEARVVLNEVSIPVDVPMETMVSTLPCVAVEESSVDLVPPVVETLGASIFPAIQPVVEEEVAVATKVEKEDVVQVTTSEVESIEGDSMQEWFIQQTEAVVIDTRHQEEAREEYEMQMRQDKSKWDAALVEIEMLWQEQEKEMDRERERREEERERIQMHMEEVLVVARREYVLCEQERKWMEEEETMSMSWNVIHRQRLQLEREESARMIEEELFTRRFLEQQAFHARQQRLALEKNAMRVSFFKVMTELRKRQEAIDTKEAERRVYEANQERKENMLMRSEERQQRQIMAQLKALKEEERRASERRRMSEEDELGSNIRKLTRQEAYERERMEMEEQLIARVIREQETAKARSFECFNMAVEDELSRQFGGWVQLRRQQYTHLAMAVYRIQCMSRLRRAWNRWSAYIELPNVAAEIIQLSWRQFVAWRAQMALEAQIESERMVSAKVLQSAYRGHAIRRKFANAIAFATLLNGNQGPVDEFEEVDMNEWMDLPPELADGWENPDIPVQLDTSELVVPEASVMEAYSYSIAEASLPPVSNQERSEGQEAPKEVSSTVNLWNRMKRNKQRQQRVAAERSRQRDPGYRLNKFLRRTKGPETTEVQTESSVTWSTASSKKTRLKSSNPLPSLVDRLRKKTAAARSYN